MAQPVDGKTETGEVGQRGASRRQIGHRCCEVVLLLEPHGGAGRDRRAAVGAGQRKTAEAAVSEQGGRQHHGPRLTPVVMEVTRVACPSIVICGVCSVKLPPVERPPAWIVPPRTTLAAVAGVVGASAT